MKGTRQHWRHHGTSAALYDMGVQQERVARVLASLLWGSAVGRLYSEVHLLSHVPEGSLVIDVPCGGGVAFRGLRPDQQLAYVAVDVSRSMLARAARQAACRGLSHVRFVEADVEALPFREGHFDLCLAYNSLHCFADPGRAVSELVRVLGPGGVLRGSAVLTGAGRRQDVLITLCRSLGVFGPSGRPDELRSWLAGAGLNQIRVQTSGAMAFFQAQKPG